MEPTNGGMKRDGGKWLFGSRWRGPCCSRSGSTGWGWAPSSLARVPEQSGFIAVLGRLDDRGHWGRRVAGMAGLFHINFSALIYPAAVSGAGPFIPLRACRRQGLATQRTGREVGGGEDKRRKSTLPDSSAPRFRLTWMISGGRPDMALPDMGVPDMTAKGVWFGGLMTCSATRREDLGHRLDGA